MSIIQDLGYGDAGAWRLYNTSGVPSSGAHEPTKAEIKKFIDAIADTIGADSILNYGGDPGGTADNSDAFDAAVAACIANGTKVLRLPATSAGSTYNFTSEPSKINAPIAILGDGIERTIVHKSYVGSASTRGLFHCEGSPFRIGGMSIIAQAGAKTGAAVGLIATGASVEPGWSSLDSLYISSGPADGWDYGVLLDGSLNTGAAIGVRDIEFNRIYSFGANVRSILLKSPYILNWTGGAVFQETGSGNADGTLEIVGTSDAPAQNLNISLETIGNLRIGANVNNSQIRFGRCDKLYNNANNSGIITMGRIITSAEQNWPYSGINTCRHIDPVAGGGSNGTGNWWETSPGSNMYVQQFTTTVTDSFVTKSFPKTFATGGIIGVSAVLSGSNGHVATSDLSTSSVKLATATANSGASCRVMVWGFGPLT